MTMLYNNPNDVKSSIDSNNNGGQPITYLYEKNALIEARKKSYFTQLASTRNLPKHYGKKIRRQVYIPLLDDRNKNDQGLDATGAKIVDGNLYGSSRDIGTITKKFPLLSEKGGKVNRVGFSRIERESSLLLAGFYYEYTKESMDFDSDPSLGARIYEEAIKGAHELVEDMLQQDLINSAGVTLFGGAATKNSEITGEGAIPSILTYDLLMRLDRILTANRTPKQTKIITGSTKIDTRVVPSCRIAYVGPELTPVLRKLTDGLGQPAFKSVETYADAGNILTGEVGAVGSFRFIEVPEMEYWAGAGANVGNDVGYSHTGGKYDVFPLLVVGDDAFNTIVFQNDGVTKNFNIIHKQPGKGNASADDPYGFNGFVSISFYYGFLCNWPERIGLIKVAAPR